MNYIIKKQNISRQQLLNGAHSTRAGWGACALVCLLLGSFAAPARADGSFTEQFGNTLNLVINTNTTTVTFTSTGSSYSIALGTGMWSGSDNGNVTGNGTATLTVTSTGISAYSLNGIYLTNTGTADVVEFGASTGSYGNFIKIILSDAGDAINFTGDTTFTTNNGLIARSSGTLTVGSVSLSASGAGAFDLAAAGALTVNTGASINAPFVSLSADTKTDLSPDDGTGTLSINGSASVLGDYITLVGADIDIDTVAPATIGNGTTLSIFISPSLPVIPISLGGANNQIPGAVNLTNPELLRLTVTTSNGLITIGNSVGQAGDIHCNGVALTLPSGTKFALGQDPGSPGSILLDSGGTALDVGSALLDLTVGMSGLVTNTDPVNSIVANGVTIESGSGPIIMWISSPPMNGDSFTIIHSNRRADLGKFCQCPTGGECPGALYGTAV